MTKKSTKTNINNSSTWVYPNIPGGVTIIRKENVIEDEIYDIYKECIEIQRKACTRLIKQQNQIIDI